jgi:hypothetical protein
MRGVLGKIADTDLHEVLSKRRSLVNHPGQGGPTPQNAVE